MTNPSLMHSETTNRKAFRQDLKSGRPNCTIGPTQMIIYKAIYEKRNNFL